MTLIVMLILAGISLSGLIGGKGLFKRTEDASNIYNEKKAREVLETVLLTDGQFEKNINPEYNEEEFLNKLIKEEIPGSDVRGDVAIIGGEYAYELDRSVPKIGKYLGNPKDLIWPEVVIVNEPTLIENGRKAKFKIRATIDEKATKGITRIELWLNGKKLNQDREYENEQREVEEEYIVNRNGVYTIKAYAELMGSNKTIVEGIVPAVEFSPNGSTEWKKQHSTKITVRETAETITEMKYVWTDSEDEPTEFTETCTNNSTITGKGFTGKYYLWIWFKTSENRTNVCGSNAFYFDNEGPKITSLTTEKYSETGITVNVTAKDTESKITKIEFYIDDKIQDKYTKTISVPKESIMEAPNITSLCTGTHSCRVVIYDALGNYSSESVDGSTKLHVWDLYAWEWSMSASWKLLESGKSLGSSPSFSRSYTSMPTLGQSSPWNSGTAVKLMGTNNNYTGGTPASVPEGYWSTTVLDYVSNRNKTVSH